MRDEDSSLGIESQLSKLKTYFDVVNIGNDMNWLAAYLLLCTAVWIVEVYVGIKYNSEEVKFSMPFLIIFSYWPIVNLILLLLVYKNVKSLKEEIALTKATP